MGEQGLQLGRMVAGKRLLLGVEIFSTGTHHPANSPPQTWTAEDLDGIISAFNAGIPDAVHIKIGHTTPEFVKLVAEQLGVPEAVVQGEAPEGDGQISLGRVISLRRRQNKLVADMEMPEQVAQLIMKGYSTVSCELLKDFEHHAWVLSSVALLGAERPAVGDQAGLAAAAILVERKPELVCAFSVAPGGQIIEYAEPEIDEIDAALEDAIRGKRGAPFIRSVWKEIRGRWEKLRQHKKPTQEADDMELDAIAKKLQMQEGASPEEISAFLDGLGEALARLREMLGLGAEAPPEEVAEKAKAKLGEIARFKADAGKDKTDLAQATERIAALEKAGRLAHFKEQVTRLSAVEGTPEQLAERLVNTEIGQGEEAAKERLIEWQKTQEFAERAGVLKRIGSAREGTETDFMGEVARYREEHKDVDQAAAIKFLMKEKPELFRAHTAAVVSPNGA